MPLVSTFYSIQISYPINSKRQSWNIHCTKRGTWWRHQMETFSALLTIFAWNSPVTGEFHAKRPVTRSFDVFFDMRLNKRLSKQSWCWWFETPSRPLWRHCNDRLRTFSYVGSHLRNYVSIDHHDVFIKKRCNIYNYADDNFVSHSSPDVNVIFILSWWWYDELKIVLHSSGKMGKIKTHNPMYLRDTHSAEYTLQVFYILNNFRLVSIMMMMHSFICTHKNLHNSNEKIWQQWEKLLLTFWWW